MNEVVLQDRRQKKVVQLQDQFKICKAMPKE